MTASGEVRLVPVSREQRDWWASLAVALRGEAQAYGEIPLRDAACASIAEAGRYEALVAGWDAAVPGVVDSSWVEVVEAQVRVSNPVHWRLSDPELTDAAVGHAVRRIARAAAGGQATAERSLPSRADAVWTVDDLPHLLDGSEDDVVAEIHRTAGGERPSVSLRETIETLPGVLSAIWASRNGYDEIRKREFLTIIVRVDREMVEGRQVEREAEEGERDE